MDGVLGQLCNSQVARSCMYGRVPADLSIPKIDTLSHTYIDLLSFLLSNTCQCTALSRSSCEIIAWDIMCILGSCFLALLVLLGAGHSVASPTNGDKKNVMIILKDVQSLLRVRAMCAYTTSGFKIKAATLGMDDDCHMPHVCKRVYSKLFSGFSGSLDAQDLAKVQRCLPRAILYEEEDAKVQKLEGKHRSNPYWLGNTSTYGDGVSSFAGMSQQYYFKEDNPEIVQGFDKGEKKHQELTLQWHLDRVDQRELPLDRQYKYDTSVSTGKGVTIYVLDSGARMTHQEFSGRIRSGFDFIDDDESADDCDGHGTHVAATAAGKGVGVAKDAEIVAVRILDCNGDGSVSDTVAALDWVAEHAKGPSVVVLSLGIEGPSSGSRILEEATRALVRNYGITTVVASGTVSMLAIMIATNSVCLLHICDMCMQVTHSKMHVM